MEFYFQLQKPVKILAQNSNSCTCWAISEVSFLALLAGPFSSPDAGHLSTGVCIPCVGCLATKDPSRGLAAGQLPPCFLNLLLSL